MLNLAEYRKASTGLADYLPWACLVAPGVVLNKDGSFQRTLRYRGPDLDSATEAELVSVTARLNNVLKRFGAGWALFFEAERIPANAYPGARFADPASWLVDQERYAAFSADGVHHESRYYLTFLYLPPPENEARADRLLYERSDETAIGVEPRAQLEWFITETDRALQMLASILPEAEALDDAATLTYLHGTISDKRHPVAVPAVPAHIDAILCDRPFLGGLEPKLGDQHLRVLTVLGFPNATVPGVLDALNDLGFAYRWTTRWIALDKTEATRHLTRLRRQWFAKRKSVSAILREVMFNRETALVDPDADNKAMDADEALQELGQDDVAFGYLTTAIVVADVDVRQANEKLLAVERIINTRGFVTIRETLNAVETWLGSLPGNPYANVRQPIMHTLNLAHMMPVSAVWAGPEMNRHLNAPTLMMAETRGATPFRLDLHVGDVGHTLIVGPTGAGKSVLLALLALQFRRFIGAQVVLFDRGRSARAATLAMGGASIDLGLEGTLSLQPLARIDEPGEIAFALQWVTALLTAEGVRVTPEVKDAVWTALKSLASAPRAERTLTGLAVLIQSAALVAALSPYTLEGAYGRLLDGSSEEIAETDVLHIELEQLMAHKALIPPVLTYLFHRLEARFDGQPTLLVLDEAWTFLDDALFAARIREWLKTLRKRNVAVVFASQSLADIERSSIAPALIESCPTRIFLPNDRALEPQAKTVYERFGLNARQIEILSVATPKRDYYAQTARGNRLFALGLGPVALALCGASSPDDQRLIEHCLATSEPKSFAARFLAAKNLAWAAELLDGWQAPTAIPPPLPPAVRKEAVQPEAPAEPKDRTALAPKAPSANTSLAEQTPLPGLPGGPPLPQRLSPFRVTPSQAKGAGQ
ncbi:MAG: conjugal transfer protein TrbE [Hyphomicrobium sp.]|uniref:conjugal transfer protein TrbE n=1 Tax=Hyphomicrobium sp. TaxID=82 RepID=UPI001323EFD3|nr:conjugal transfer protein TrbE [Hyphomicrobium sp.]KAB2943504.1 MAG: conjugal transfer protein TrbE [Hyphomicrobium sp.]MBZ0208771.1 conjugal transfer protein TrbE [Hyphomicrobium sp.]